MAEEAAVEGQPERELEAGTDPGIRRKHQTFTGDLSENRI